MNSPRTMQRYHYAIRMVKASSFEDSALLDFFSSEDPDNSNSLFYKIRQACVCSEHIAPQLNNVLAYQILIEAVGEYLYAFSTTRTIKKRLYSRMYAWCEHMGQQFGIDDYQTWLEDIPNQFDVDLSVELVKELHDQKGITKAELAEKYRKSIKTFQVYLSKISNKTCAEPLRVGGQAIYVPVSHKEEKYGEDERRYYTPNTMSPVIFQMNIMQVATLLQSLQLNYEKGNNIPFDLAIDTWSQLSDYAKERIREVFCERDPAFSKFIDDIDGEERSDTYRFMTESEILKSGQASWSEMLLIADKGGQAYNLVLTQPLRSRKNQRIMFDHSSNRYYAVPMDKLFDEPLYFSEEQIRDICEA